MEANAEALLSLARGVLGGMGLEELLDQVLASARSMTGARYAAIGVLAEQEDGAEFNVGLARFLVAGIDQAARAAIGALPEGHGVLGELIRDPRPLRLADVGAHPRSFGFPAGHPAMSTFLGAPVFLGDKPFGNIYLTEKSEGRQFTDADEKAIVALAELAGLAIENAVRYSDSRDRRDELERAVTALQVTAQITRAVGGRTDLETILDLVAKRGRAVVEARTLLIEVEDGPELVVAAGAGALPASLIGTRLPLEGSVADQALRTRRTQRLSDELNRARFQDQGLGAHGISAEHALIVPLVFHDRTYGVLLAFDRIGGSSDFSEDDVRLLEAFAASAATAVATGTAVAADLQRLASVVESSGDAIITVDRAGLITTWNPGAEALYRRSSEEMLGRVADDAVPGVIAGEGEQHILARTLAGEVISPFEVTRMVDGGSELELSISIAAIRDAHGKVIGAASIARDVGEQKQMQRMLSQGQRLDSIGQLAGGVAHDINNLMAIIINRAEFALGRMEDGPQATEVREIRHTAERAAALMRQLLLFARHDSNVKPALLELDVAVASTAQMLARTLGEHIDLQLDLASSLWVNADPTQLEQVVMNLALTGRDAMPGGGVLAISTSSGTLERAHSRRLGLPGDHVCLAVADTGGGMSPELISRVFEPFFTTKPTGEGTGLGLATVYGIVTKAGGHTEIESEPGKGTIVKVYWPLAHPPADVERSPSELAADALRKVAGERILLVEDEGALRSIIVRLLVAEGYVVLAAGLPSEAMEIAGRDDQRIDLLLSDVVMPEMSGAKLAERLHGRRPNLPSLFISGYVARPEELPKDAAFVSKPFTGAGLLEAVGRAIDAHRPARAQTG